LKKEKTHRGYNNVTLSGLKKGKTHRGYNNVTLSGLKKNAEGMIVL
jgi:hypothetical protein